MTNIKQFMHAAQVAGRRRPSICPGEPLSKEDIEKVRALIAEMKASETKIVPWPPEDEEGDDG